MGLFLEPKTPKSPTPTLPRKDTPIPAKPASLSPTGLGIVGIVFGFTIFLLGVFSGFNLLIVGLGLAFIVAGAATKQKPPVKLCPACRMEIPLEASVCGHCRSALTA